MSDFIIKAQNLVRDYVSSDGLFKPKRVLHALDDVSFNVERGKTLAIVGESGCGKSTLARILTMIDPHTSGQLMIDGDEVDLKKRPPSPSLRQKVQIVFQDPYGSLHPRQTIDRLLLEPLVIHRFDHKEQRISQALDDVGLGRSMRFRYTHQLSGGQRQRVAIARALIVEPKILLLDEPTSALDASIQAEILNLLDEIRARQNLTFIMVSHDLSVISHMCDRLAVMHQGKIVETLTPDALISHQYRSPYTAQLLRASAGFHREKDKV